MKGGPCPETAMKVCVFSDSHGVPDKLISAILREGPALFFFLGDGECDLATVRSYFPSLPYFAVRGNCDLRSSLSGEIVCTIGGVSFFATHGYLYDVKYEPTLERLTEAARAAGASVALFGHTHKALCKRFSGVLCLNPGSIGRGRYAVLSVADGKCTPELKTL